jgi:pyruvate dehydrogenase E2 component (dihydrolipoamide acetyltransferase)
MVLSKRTSPHVYTVAEIDMSAIAAFRERAKKQFEEREGFNLTFTPFILYAAVQALLKWPIVNSSMEGDDILLKKYVNLGVAVAVPDGLIVPVIKSADEKNFLGLARSNYDLSLRAKEKRLQPDDVQGGTFTVTNPGIFRNLFGLPIINQPQAAILGVGAVKKRPVVIDDAIAIRSMMYATLSYDHRIIDGAIAGQFLQEVVRNLEQFDLESSL